MKIVMQLRRCLYLSLIHICNAPDSKLSYQWYAAQTQKGEITVTDAVAKKSADARSLNSRNEWRVKCGDEIDCFTPVSYTHLTI